jgi:TPP-dependent pyruvate/acetoin dehydrogenase alpha subunit
MNLAKSAATLYQNLIRVRLTEEAIVAEYGNQEMKCPVHLSIGQEAAAVGVCVALKDSDVAFSTHRCHSHYLAKGGDLNAMIAELYGKKTGCAAGLGGSMHLVDERVGMMGASAIVGGSIPLAVGAALKFKLDRLPHVAVAFFGDGASEEGVFHESMNFAALHKLPVLFVCENNFAATASPLDARRSVDNIFEHGNMFGVPGTRVDGNNLPEVYQAALEAVDRARAGNGPSLIEARTYRLMKHVGPQEDKTSGSRTPEEWEQWKQKCPVKQFEVLVLKNHWLKQDEMEQIQTKIRRDLKAAFQFARESEPAEWLA